MFSRRTRARIDFVGYVLSLCLRVFLWRRTSGENEEPPLAPQWLIGGGLYEATYNWAYDRDLGAIRANRWRRVGFSMTAFLLRRGLTLGFRASSRSESAQRNFSMGRSVGGLAYRLWYGVLRPLPGTDE